MRRSLLLVSLVLASADIGVIGVIGVSPARAQSAGGGNSGLGALNEPVVIDVPLPDNPTLNQSLEDVVVLAAKRPQPVREAAASTSVITAADLVAYGWRDWTEAINSLAGIYLTDPRDFTHIGVRGVSPVGDFNGRILILVDGHTQQELWSHSAYPEQIGIDAIAIDHIEVLRGPASSLYGSLGFLAIINIVTRRGTQKEWGRVAWHMEDISLFRGAANIGRTLKNGFEASLSMQATYGRGDTFTYRDLAANPTCYNQFPRSCTMGVSDRETDASLAFSGFGHISYRGFWLRGSYQYYDKNIPYAPYETLFNDRTNHLITTRGYVSAGVELGRPEIVQLQARGYYDIASYVDDLAYADDAGTRYVFHDEAHPFWAGGEAKVLHTGEYRWFRYALTGGGDFTYLHGENKSGVVGESPVVIDRDIRFGSLYGQAELTIAQRLALTLGLRGDFSDTFPDELSPRAGLVVFPWSTGTWKLLYSHGFIRPSWYYAFFTDNDAIQPNPALRPERADNVEIVYQQQLGRPLALTASAFYIRGQDIIEQRAVCVDMDAVVGAPVDGACDAGEVRQQRQNAQSFTVYGAEAGVVGRWDGGARLYANYSFAHVESQEGEDASAVWPVNSPRHLFKAGLSYPLWRDHLVAGVEWRYWSARRYSIDTSDIVSAHLQLNAHLQWRDLPKGFSATIKVYNLTNQTWDEPSVAENSYPITRIPHGGVRVQLRLTYAF